MNKRRTTLIAFVAGGLLLSTFALAQNSPQTAQDQNASHSTNASAAPEKSQGDETAEFKHSWSVQKLAKFTHLSEDHAFWLAVILNFVVVIGLIPPVVNIISRMVVGVDLKTALRNRTSSIQKAVVEARRASEDANRRLSDIESRLSRLDTEISQMKAESEKEAAAEEERIKAAAAEDARRIIESAHQEIEAATKSARRELTAHAADLAVSLATKQIHVDTPTDQALLRRFAQQLSTDGVARKKS